jgi:tetratricopeptide (TPR) repeat protein
MAISSNDQRNSPEEPQPAPAGTDEISFLGFVIPGWKTLLPAFVIVAAAFWIYRPVLHGDWVWDDIQLVAANPNLRGLHGLWDIWFAPPLTDYWPLTFTLFWFILHILGPSSLGFHLASLLLHLANCFLIWRLFNRLGMRWGWLGALIFAVHPLTVESVAWISETKNTFSLLFYLLAFDAWLDEEEGKRRGYWRSLFFYLAALLCKSSTIMLPTVFLLYAWWKHDRVTWPDLRKTLPFFGLAVILGLVSVYLQNSHPLLDAPKPDSLFSRVTAAFLTIPFYLGKFLVPTGLVIIYPRWKLESPSLLQLLPIPIVLGVLALLWSQRRAAWGRHTLFGLGFFLFNLFPVMGIIPISYMIVSWVADHFVYLPMIGLIGLAVLGLETAYARWAPALRPVILGFCVCFLALFAWQSHRYSAVFVNQKTLWTYALPRNPGAWAVHFNLGIAYGSMGLMEESIEQYQEALKIDPHFFGAHNDLGVDFAKTDRLPEAVEQFEEALKIEPTDVATLNNLGTALARMGRFSEAIDQFEAALRVDPKFAAARKNLEKVEEMRTNAGGQ